MNLLATFWYQVIRFIRTWLRLLRSSTFWHKVIYLQRTSSPCQDKSWWDYENLLECKQSIQKCVQTKLNNAHPLRNTVSVSTSLEIEFFYATSGFNLKLPFQLSRWFILGNFFLNIFDTENAALNYPKLFNLSFGANN